MGVDLHQQRLVEIVLLGIDLGLKAFDRIGVCLDRSLINLHLRQIFFMSDIGYASVFIFTQDLHARQAQSQDQTDQQHTAPVPECEQKQSGKADFPQLCTRMIAVCVILITQLYSSQIYSADSLRRPASPQIGLCVNHARNGFPVMNGPNSFAIIA